MLDSLCCVYSVHSRLQLEDHEWEQYAHFDSSRHYTRNLIATDGTSYTLLLLCWNPGMKSPIHDHPCDGCWMRVCRGNVQERRFVHDSNSEKLECIHDETYSEGQLAYVADWMGYHSVGNPSSLPAVTLHLYSPPIQECKVWHSETCAPSTSTSTHYSEYGSLV